VLSGLCSLHLRGVYCYNGVPHCYDPLLSMPRLRRLALTSCTHLPACLPRLTVLEVSGSHGVGGQAGQWAGGPLSCPLPCLVEANHTTDTLNHCLI